jgi:tetratricopeptide (TPR) repeat protein
MKYRASFLKPLSISKHRWASKMKKDWHILLIVGLAASAEITYPAQFINPAQAAPAAKAKAGANELPPNFAAGVKAYQEKRYNEAISYFREAISKENGGANGWLYLAHSYFAMGLRYQAAQSYQTITEQFKGSAQAAQATQCLQRLSASSSTSAASASTTSSPTGGAPGADNGKGKDSPVVAAVPLEQRVSTVRPRINHPEVSAALVRAVKKWIVALPPGIKTLLEKSDMKIVITPTMIDSFPEGEYQEVRGYEGGTSKSCPGLYNGSIYLAEHTVDEGSNQVKPAIDISDIEDTFKHETGHAIDHCLGDITTTEEYKHGYRLDTAHVPDNTAARIRYYLQMNETGWAESFAQLVATKLGSHRDINDELTANLPRSYKFVCEVLK